MKEESKKKNSFIGNKVKRFIESTPPEKMHTYARGTIENRAIFPWEDVENCMDDKLNAAPNRLVCPVCGMPSDKLSWIIFQSPKWTWENLMGRGGPLSICTDCHCQVEFICVIMN